MRLYSGTTQSLVQDSTYNRIATKLSDAFFAEFRHQPSPSEVTSWNNSLRAVSQVFQAASLLDHGVLLELQLPLTSKRLDCMVTGYDGATKTPTAVVIELKQWGGCEGVSGKNEVATFVGCGVRTSSTRRFRLASTECIWQIATRRFRGRAPSTPTPARTSTTTTR